jgi:hypothetical protein
LLLLLQQLEHPRMGELLLLLLPLHPAIISRWNGIFSKVVGMVVLGKVA